MLLLLCLFGVLVLGVAPMTTEHCFSFLSYVVRDEWMFLRRGGAMGRTDGRGEQHIEGVYVVFTLVGHHVSLRRSRVNNNPCMYSS